MKRQQHDQEVANPQKEGEEHDPNEEGRLEQLAWQKHRERQRMPLMPRQPEEGRVPDKEMSNTGNSVGRSDRARDRDNDASTEAEGGLLCTAPLDTFFPSLASLASVQRALRKEFGETTGNIVAQLKAGQLLSDEDPAAQDIILDLVHNKAVCVESIDGLGSDGSGIFSINIMRFGSVFWIDALGFDDLGYFHGLEQARRAAKLNYEPFITAALCGQNDIDE